MNIVLIGYRCCGKTSAGRLVAEKLDRQFIDTDEMIIKKAGCSIDEIVSNKGWQYFREIEKGVIKEVSSMENLVVATGGGVVVNEENVQNLRSNGFVVWLYADILTISKRLNEDGKTSANRPSLTGDKPSDEIKKVLEQRNPLYKDASDMGVDTTHASVEEVADLIINNLDRTET